MFVKTIFLIFLTLFSSSAALSEETRKEVKEVMVITVDGVINPVSAEYIGKSIKKAMGRKPRRS
jgi:membrane-bound ClpP family serine protease